VEATLTAPNIIKELPICNVFDYIEKVDNSIEDKGFDIQNQYIQ